MKNNKKIISLLLAVLMMASLSVTAFAADDPTPTPNLENFTGDSMSGTMDFNYTVTHENTYTELSAVKLDWSVPVLKYTKTDTRTWDTTSLKWVQSHPESTSGDDVSFTLTNRGTYAVKANVSFTQDSGITTADTVTVAYGEKDPDDETKTINGNDPVIDSIVGDAHALKVAKGTMTDAEYKTARDTYVKENCQAVIKGKVTVSDYSKLSDSGKLGTYTVKISDPSKHTVTVIAHGGGNAGGPTTTIIEVPDGAAISTNGYNITINGDSYTTADNYGNPLNLHYFNNWQSGTNTFKDGESYTVTDDLTITAVYT